MHEKEGIAAVNCGNGFLDIQARAKKCVVNNGNTFNKTFSTVEKDKWIFVSVLFVYLISAVIVGSENGSVTQVSKSEKSKA